MVGLWGADDAVSHFRDGVNYHPIFVWGARTLHTLPQRLKSVIVTGPRKTTLMVGGIKFSLST